MRMSCLLVVGAVACGSGSNEPPRTRGPVANMVHLGLDAVRIEASHHLLELAELPVARATGGLPARGTIEVGANIRIPLDGVEPDFRRARGKLAVRCVGACQLGDDATRLALPAALADDGDGLGFSHLDLSGLEAHVTFADGHARLTSWSMKSVDVELQLELDVTLARDLDDARLDGCVRLRPTEALRARDPRLHTLLTLVAPVRDDDGRVQFRITGPVSAPRLIAAACGG